VFNRLKPLIGKKVDSIEHHERVINSCNTMLAEHTATFVRNPRYSPVGFATFNSIGEATAVIKSTEGAGLKARAAPEEVFKFSANEHMFIFLNITFLSDGYLLEQTQQSNYS
jgi:hypothetical protein